MLSLPVMGGILGDPDVLTLVAADPSQVAFGALLILVMGLALAMVPALMFPILKRHSEPLAIGYVIFRGALETFTYIALAMCWLLLVVVARQYADSAAAVASQWSSLGTLLLKAQDPISAVTEIVFSLGALMFYCLLYQARLIPRWISGFGIVAAVAYLAAGLSAMFGTPLEILMLLMLVQEMVMAVWLIVKGFNSSAIGR
jgi:energy-converting hydrogenase Eha subunit C